VIAIQIFDPLERELPPPGDYAISDGQHRLSVSTRAESVRKRFHDEVLLRQAALKDALTGLRIPLIELSTHQKTLPVVQKFLCGGGLL
jgi:hypothetical protein